MKIHISRIFFLLLLWSPSLLYAHNGDSLSLRVPFDFPLLLSGNFGELRSNHFHAGLDFKTQGAVGKPIYSPADGYISRATVSSGGYGRAVYVTHSNGYMTVYGHLDRFLPAVARKIAQVQYADEAFAVDVKFSPNEFPVSKGDIVAYSGNSGYSFGPHLHFEVRTADSDTLVNPMLFYKKNLSDDVAPVAHSVMFSPRCGMGMVNGASHPYVVKTSGTTLRDTVTAWGHIGISVKADDYMSGTHNRYGLYTIELYVDDSLRFSSRMDGYAMADTRLVNAWAEYDRYHNTGEWFLRSYILDNNSLPLLSADRNRGWVNIDEQRLYKVEYRLGDYHGNVSNYLFHVQGVEGALPQHAIATENYLPWYLSHEIFHERIHLEIPRGELFQNIFLQISEEDAPDAVSPRYKMDVHPLRNKARLSIYVSDTLSISPEKYYMRRITRKGASSVGGLYLNGKVTASIRVLGSYDVAVDTIAPRVKPHNEKRWEQSGVLSFAISDKGSGIKNFKGTIDGKFVLVEYNGMRGRLTCNTKKAKIAPGKHTFQLTVTDNCGNTTVFEKVVRCR